MRHPAEFRETEIVAFLTYLSAEQSVSRSTQMQALSALLLLYREVLVAPVGDLRRVLRSASPTRLPAVLSRSEVRALLDHMKGTTRLISLLLYGAGLRLMECLTLRVKDLDFARGKFASGAARVARTESPFCPISRSQRWNSSWCVCAHCTLGI